MGYKTTNSVYESLPRGLHRAARDVLLVLAAEANDRTGDVPVRSGEDLTTLIERRADLTPAGRNTAMRHLRDAGLDPRVPIGTDKAGRPVFAVRGRAVQYRIPESLRSNYGPLTSGPSETDGPLNDGAKEEMGLSAEPNGPLVSGPLPIAITTSTNHAREEMPEPPAPKVSGDGVLVEAIMKKHNTHRTFAADVVAGIGYETDNPIRHPLAFIRSAPFERLEELAAGVRVRREAEMNARFSAMLRNPDTCHHPRIDVEGECISCRAQVGIGDAGRAAL